VRNALAISAWSGSLVSCSSLRSVDFGMVRRE
jgi:hypothetical protein